MIIAICILAVLLFISISANLALWYALDKLMDEYIEANPDEMIKFYWDKYAEEKFPCTLLITESEDMNFEGSIYDFSHYKEKNIIALIKPKRNSENDCNDDPRFILLPNQIVLKMKDGSYQWDCRQFM